jgi:two-component system cell cycle sensor histidine kinase/response regulator CckA
LNLYINAWQAMPEGGDLSLATQNAVLGVLDVKPYGLNPGRYVKISVTDTGTGIDENIKDHIFEPFFTTKGPGKGTGLGLASAYGIIENHGGFIKVESELGRGARFDIYLPATDRRMTPGETIVEKKILPGRETILFVDDEKNNVTKEILECLGYRVMVAGSGQEAIALYMEKGREIDLIILDLIMPGMGGIKAFEVLRSINPVLKVILSSGYSVDGEARRIMDKGCNGFLQKPFRLADISQKVREILGN